MDRRPATAVFQPQSVERYPEPARRFLAHAIAPGTPLASAVRLRMHGELKLRRWSSVTAEQVIAWDHGLMWTATARTGGLPISGFDRLANGQGMTRWKLLGVLPAVLCRPDVTWPAGDLLHPRAHITVAGEAADMMLTIDGDGALQSGSLLRWSNPDHTTFRYVEFGAVVEAHRTFGGFTIPVRVRVGYYPGTPRFDSEGEFFRATIDEAIYR